MSWNTFKQHYLSINELDFALDYSRIRFPDGFFQANEEKVQSAFWPWMHLKQAVLPIQMKEDKSGTIG